MLRHPALRDDAVSALITLLERRGPLPDRAPLLGLFSAMDLITASVPGHQADTGGVDIEDHNYTLQLCHLLVALATQQLCPLWGNQGVSREHPPKFDEYLAILLQFSSHSSLKISAATLPAWLALLKHEFASKSSPVKAAVGSLLGLAFTRGERPGDPTAGFFKPEITAFCEAEGLDEAADFAEFFCVCRAQATELTRTVASVDPHSAVQAAAERLAAVLALDSPKEAAVSSGGRYTTPFACSWEAVALFLDAVIVAAKPLFVEGFEVAAAPATGSPTAVRRRSDRGARSKASVLLLRQCYEAVLAARSEMPDVAEAQFACLGALSRLLVWMPVSPAPRSDYVLALNWAYNKRRG